MGTSVVHASNEQAHPIRSLAILLCIGLRAVTDLVDYTFDRDRSAICHFGGESLLFHEIREDASIGRQTSQSYTKMLIDSYNLFLI